MQKVGRPRDATQKSRKRTGIVAFRFVPTGENRGAGFVHTVFLLSRLSCHTADDDDDGEDECGWKGVAGGKNDGGGGGRIELVQGWSVRQ